MGYRDEREALRARNEALRERIEELEAKNEELERRASGETGKRHDSSIPPARRKGVSLGAIYYQPPRSFTPLLSLAAACAANAIPQPEPPGSNSLWAWLAFHVLLVPGRYLLYPIYYLLLYPYYVALMVVGTVLLLPVLLLGGLRVRAVGEPAPWGPHWTVEDKPSARMFTVFITAVTLWPGAVFPVLLALHLAGVIE